MNVSYPCTRSGGISSNRRKCSHRTQCRSFLKNIATLLGGTNDERGGEQQRPTVGKSSLNSNAGHPIFPPYNVINKNSDYALRLYDVFPVVEMEYRRREEGYASLGSYIDGNNSQGACFAYTQPVVMCYYPDGRKVMQIFVGPRVNAMLEPPLGEGVAATVTSLPSPLEPAVRINVSGGELVAVLQFEGYITPESAKAARQRLIACLQRDGIQLSEADATGRFRCAQYGAAYQLGGRLNEIMLQVTV